MCDKMSPAAFSAISAIILVIYSSFLTIFASCGCVKGNEFLLSYCNYCKIFIEFFGGQVLSVFFGTLKMFLYIKLIFILN
jgi:hypothetical protein